MDDKIFDATQRISSNSFNTLIRQAKKLPPSLILLIGPPELIGRQWVLEQGEFTLGRSLNAQIQINDPSLSRSHARLIISNQSVSLEDLDSTNGTAIEGNALTKSQPANLQDNNYIQVGNVIFKYLEEGNIDSVASQQSFRRAQYDGLTDSYNKRAFLEMIPCTFLRAKTNKLSLSMIVFDLDQFKILNDTYGHHTGDQVLKNVVALIKTQLRPSDFLARYGGEEFIVVLSDTDLQKAMEVAERLRTIIHNQELLINQQLIKTAISLGTAELRPAIKTWEELFETCDKALYQAKQQGRNQSVTIQT